MTHFKCEEKLAKLNQSRYISEFYHYKKILVCEIVIKQINTVLSILFSRESHLNLLECRFPNVRVSPPVGEKLPWSPVSVYQHQ